MKYNMNISPVDDCVWLNKGCTLLIDGDTPEEAANAAQALNDFCRLTEENAKLREALEGLTESASVNEEQLNDLLMCGDYGESKELCDAKQLLNQLKDQNNDK